MNINSIKKNIKSDKRLITLLKVESITYPLLKTTKGELSMSLRKNEDEYYFSLDSVELDKELSKEITNVLSYEAK